MGILQRMRGLLSSPPPSLAALGVSALAVRCADGVSPPAGCAVLYVGLGGQVRVASGRAAGSPVACRDGEAAWLMSSASLRCSVAPFAAAPELGLQLDFCFDAAGGGQRFGLYLAGELAGGEMQLPLTAVSADVQQAVQAALQQGALELPPCMSDEEWQTFRAGLNELVFTRFGLIVEDCVPVDRHPATDFAAQLSTSAAERGPLELARETAATTSPGAPAGEPSAEPRNESPVAPPSARPSRSAAAPSASPSASTSEAGRAGQPGEPTAASPAKPSAATMEAGRAAQPGKLTAASPPATSAVLPVAPRAMRQDEPMAAPPATPADGVPGAPSAARQDEPNAAHLAAMFAGVARAHRAQRAGGDAASLRRLFLELPALAAGFRALPIEEGAGQFAPLQDILRRIQLAALSVNTMPSLEVSAPGEKTTKRLRESRTAHSAAAQAALDEAWSLLAAMRAAGVSTHHLDEADRILSNLEFNLAHRRATSEEPA